MTTDGAPVLDLVRRLAYQIEDARRTLHRDEIGEVLLVVSEAT